MAWLGGGLTATAANNSGVRSPRFFATQIQPLLTESCLKCHSREKHKGDLDLEQFSSVDAMRKEPRIWEEVASQVQSGEMPPRDSKAPSGAQRREFLAGVNAFLDDVAKSVAGDPGPVLLRRLSNAEYTYTVRDLTGVPSLDPVREFPADGASGEGFMNVGNSLVMSPSLISKYLDAAKEIAGHAILVPDGIRFSPHTSTRDWTDDSLSEIRALYREYTDPQGGDMVNLQGIVFSTNEGGRLPLEKYLLATFELRDKSRGTAADIDAVAKRQNLSPKYLALLFNRLRSTEASFLLDPLRAHWKTAGRTNVAALVNEVVPWQKALWKFSSVGHIGKAGGPKAWMEPVTPLVSRQELRLKLAPTNATQPVTVFLVVGNAGDGSDHDIAVWQKPRLVVKGRPDINLRDVPTVPQSNAGQLQALNPQRFGHNLDGTPSDPDDLVVQAPSVVSVRIPADLAAGAELVATGKLASGSGDEGSVQFQILTNQPTSGLALLETGATVSDAPGPWTSDRRRMTFASPIVVNDSSAARQRLDSAMGEFRQLFPAALCYTKIVPVDEVVTLTLFYREDDQLSRLMLDETQKRRLDRLWDELHFVTRDALTTLDGFEQLWQFATQDADPKVFEPLREPLKQKAAAFREVLINCQPRHLDAVLAFANKAYRRPLSESEKLELRSLYERLRKEELSHEDAIRLTLARVFVAPAFLYHAETPFPGSRQGPVSSTELASRLSYLFWSSTPDAQLMAATEQDNLLNPVTLRRQTRRLMQDARVRRMATEFACAWLHIYNFNESGEKSERQFPTFPQLRGAMYEETIRFFTDFFQRDGSILEILDGDSTFLNEALARHYAIPGVAGEEWRRVDGIHRYGRGGVLGQASVLAQNSGASRTSPILRGNWISEVLLGEKLPRPPKDVPRLPEEEATAGLTMRELTEKHSRDPRCAGCHVRIDAMGFSLESFDAIGRRRDHDLGNRVLDTRVKVMDGSEFEGADGLRQYLLNQRRDAFVQQFCRKLLGYALGRSVQLSDRPLLAEMRSRLAGNHYHVTAAIDVIVNSRQFREIRGRDFASAE
jgi:Protein of unknown function (DUF1592)/Protein of unknown function (DUF1588)/Protein of unknown function (DUF1587)/Protein of unknown function (DUF1585)/Protein of unknown function (DUF1595)/Planctomycete cytochrome C